MDTPPPPSKLLQLPTHAKSSKRSRNAKNLSLNVPSFAQLSVVAMASPKTAVAPSFSFANPPPPHSSTFPSHHSSLQQVSGQQDLKSSRGPLFMPSKQPSNKLNSGGEFKSSFLRSDNETTLSDKSNMQGYYATPLTNTAQKPGFASSESSSLASPVSLSHPSHSSSPSPSSLYSSQTSSPSSSFASNSPNSQKQTQALFISIPQSPSVATHFPIKPNHIYPTASAETAGEAQRKQGSQTKRKAYPSYPISHYQEYKHDSVASPSTFFQATPPEEKCVIVNTIPLGDPTDLEPSYSSYPSGPIVVCHPNIYLYSEPTLEEASQFDVVINVAKEVRNPFLDKSVNENSASIFIPEGNKNISAAGLSATQNTKPLNYPSTNFDSNFPSQQGFSNNSQLPFLLETGLNPQQQQQQHSFSPFLSDYNSKNGFDSSSLSSSSSSYSTLLSVPSSPPSLGSSEDTAMSSPTSNSSLLSSPSLKNKGSDVWPHIFSDLSRDVTTAFSETESETHLLNNTSSALASSTRNNSIASGNDLVDRNIYLAMSSDSTIGNKSPNSVISSSTDSVSSSPTRPFQRRTSSSHRSSLKSSNSNINLELQESSGLDFKRSNSTGSGVKKPSNESSKIKSRRFIGDQRQGSFSTPCINLSINSKEEPVSLQQNQPTYYGTKSNNDRNNFNDSNDYKKINTPECKSSVEASSDDLSAASESKSFSSSSSPEYIYVPWDHNSALASDLEHLTSILFDRSNQGKKILVHCQCGVSRSASLLVAYVMRLNGWGVHQAYAWVKDKSPGISPNMSLIYQLVEWAGMVEEIEQKQGSRFPNEK